MTCGSIQPSRLYLEEIQKDGEKKRRQRQKKAKSIGGRTSTPLDEVDATLFDEPEPYKESEGDFVDDPKVRLGIIHVI